MMRFLSAREPDEEVGPAGDDATRQASARDGGKDQGSDGEASKVHEEDGESRGEPTGQAALLRRRLTARTMVLQWIWRLGQRSRIVALTRRLPRGGGSARGVG